MKHLIVQNKWEQGIDVCDSAHALARLIYDMDFYHFGDSFCFKFGGDGDNGETLACIIDALIENNLVDIKIKDNNEND